MKKLPNWKNKYELSNIIQCKYFDKYGLKICVMVNFIIYKQFTMNVTRDERNFCVRLRMYIFIASAVYIQTTIEKY